MPDSRGRKPKFYPESDPVHDQIPNRGFFGCATISTMTVPVGQGLYGECRGAGKCICGLCADIEFGHQTTGRPKGKASMEPTRTSDGVVHVPVRHRNSPPRKIRIKLPARPRLLMGEPATVDPCGCLIWKQRRIKWCDDLHTPQSHPNECQHERTSIQDFGLPTQRLICSDCSNGISE